MKTLKVDLDYGREQSAVDDVPNIALTRNYIIALVKNKYPQLQGQKLRIFGRIQRKLDKAVAENLHDIEIEEAEADILKEACREPIFEAQLAKFVVILIDEINNL